MCVCVCVCVCVHYMLCVSQWNWLLEAGIRFYISQIGCDECQPNARSLLSGRLMHSETADSSICLICPWLSCVITDCMMGRNDGKAVWLNIREVSPLIHPLSETHFSFFFSLSFYHCPKLPCAVIWRGILENRVKSALTNCTLIENNNNGCVGYIVLRVLLSMFRRQRWKINGTEVKSQETLFCLLLLGCLTFTVQNGARAAWLWTTVFQRLSAQRGKFLSAHL